MNRAQSLDPRTEAQKRNRKRRETHQVFQVIRQQVALEFPSRVENSEWVANRFGMARAAVQDVKIAELEQRLQALERLVAGLLAREAAPVVRMKGAAA